MPVKYCCFRFDADTHACVAKGMPLLMDLGQSLGVQFTFFVNMGRAFDRRISLAKAVRRCARGGRTGSMGVASKLGFAESCRAALFNPAAGGSSPGVLQAAARLGHEIGLHGGRNHARWERDAGAWSEEELRQEVETGCRWMAACDLPAPRSFASPAWNSPPALRTVLRTLGFHVIADVYDSGQQTVTAIDGLLSLPTNIVAGTGTAGYLEAASVRGWGSLEIAADWKRQLAMKEHLAVVYDHPFFAGTHALRQIREMVRIALDRGFGICTISETARRLQQSHSRSLLGSQPRPG